MDTRNRPYLPKLVESLQRPYVGIVQPPKSIAPTTDELLSAHLRAKDKLQQSGEFTSPRTPLPILETPRRVVVSYPKQPPSYFSSGGIHTSSSPRSTQSSLVNERSCEQESDHRAYGGAKLPMIASPRTTHQQQRQWTDQQSASLINSTEMALPRIFR